MLDTKIILLISSPRSGTNYLCSLLNNVEILDVNNEIFHNDYSYLNNYNLIKINNELLKTNCKDLQEIRKNIKNYLKTHSKKDFLQFLKNNSKKKYLFFKVFPNHLTQNELNEILLISDYKIIMQRKNIDRYISEKKAIKLNSYQKINTTDLKINFDISEYNNFKNNLNIFFNKFNNFPIINYEDFILLNKKEQLKLFFNKINLSIDLNNINIKNTLQKQDLETDYSKKIENFNKDIEKLIISEKN